MTRTRKLLFLLLPVFLIVVGLTTIFVWFHQPTNIYIDTAKNVFSDFEVSDNAVYISGHITVCNKTDKDKTVAIVGLFPYEFHVGLLKNGTLYAEQTASPAGVSKGFFLPAGTSKDFEIVFTGEFAGTTRMSARLLPEMRLYLLDEDIAP